MAKSKWIFGNQQNQPATVVVNPAPLPIESSADTRQFGLENVCCGLSLREILFIELFCDLVWQYLVRSGIYNTLFHMLMSCQLCQFSPSSPVFLCAFPGSAPAISRLSATCRWKSFGKLQSLTPRTRQTQARTKGFNVRYNKRWRVRSSRHTYTSQSNLPLLRTPLSLPTYINTSLRQGHCRSFSLHRTIAPRKRAVSFNHASGCSRIFQLSSQQNSRGNRRRPEGFAAWVRISRRL